MSIIGHRLSVRPGSGWVFTHRPPPTNLPQLHCSTAIKTSAGVWVHCTGAPAGQSPHAATSPGSASTDITSRCAAITHRPSSTSPAKPTCVGRLPAATPSASRHHLRRRGLPAEPTSPANRNHQLLRLRTPSPAHVATSSASAASCPSATVTVSGASAPSHVPSPASAPSHRRRQPLPPSPIATAGCSSSGQIQPSQSRTSPATAPPGATVRRQQKTPPPATYLPDPGADLVVTSTTVITSKRRCHLCQTSPPHRTTTPMPPTSSPLDPAGRLGSGRFRRPKRRVAPLPLRGESEAPLPPSLRPLGRQRGGGGRERPATAA